MAIDIGSRREPFMDRFLIETLDGTELRLHRPRPAGPPFPLDRPWEGRYSGYFTIIQDDGPFRMYYRGHPVDAPDGSPSESTCYAESTDGIHWERPDLGLFEVDGARDNNVILKGQEPFSHNFAPFLDTRPGVPASERLKAVAGNRETGLVAFVSEDGVHWRKLREEPIVTQGELDSQNLVFWSEHEQCYCCYLRKWTGDDSYGGLRSVARCTSPDFLHWSDIEAMTFGDTDPEELYTNQTQPYFRAPHIYIGIAARFMRGRRILSPEQFAALGGEGHYGEDCSDAIVLTSRGGTVYDRTFMEGFVRPGIGLSNWTSRTNYPVWGLIPTGDSEMSFYINRGYGHPTAHLERMALRIDGVASVNAPHAGGELVTKPFIFKGQALTVNYATSAAGSLRIEIRNEDLQPQSGYTLEDCDEIIGDEIARTVTWKGNADVSALEGMSIRLRVAMKDADLYSIRFA